MVLRVPLWTSSGSPCGISTDRIQPSVPQLHINTALTGSSAKAAKPEPGLRGHVGTREAKERAAHGVRVRAQPDSSSPIPQTGFDGCETRGGINYTNQKLNNRGGARGKQREASVAWA